MRILLFSMLPIAFVSFGQTDLSYYPKLNFSPSKIFFPDMETDFNSNDFFKPQTGNFGACAPVVKGKPYEGFFCRLEVKTEAWAGFGIQFHAGDYYHDMLNYGRQCCYGSCRLNSFDYGEIIEH